MKKNPPSANPVPRTRTLRPQIVSGFRMPSRVSRAGRRQRAKMAVAGMQRYRQKLEAARAAHP